MSQKMNLPPDCSDREFRACSLIRWKYGLCKSIDDRLRGLTTPVNLATYDKGVPGKAYCVWYAILKRAEGVCNPLIAIQRDFEMAQFTRRIVTVGAVDGVKKVGGYSLVDPAKVDEYRAAAARFRQAAVVRCNLAIGALFERLESDARLFQVKDPKSLLAIAKSRTALDPIVEWLWMDCNGLSASRSQMLTAYMVFAEFSDIYANFPRRWLDGKGFQDYFDSSTPGQRFSPVRVPRIVTAKYEDIARRQGDAG